MTESGAQISDLEQQLCKACGLCCTGHVLSFATLQPDEVEATRALGLAVAYKQDQNTWSFLLPCPLWDDLCTVYDSPQKPHICGAFKCKLLLGLEEGSLSINQAMYRVKRAKKMIKEMDAVVPRIHHQNFLMNLGKTSRVLADEMNAILEKGRLLVKIGSVFGYFDQNFVKYHFGDDPPIKK